MLDGVESGIRRAAQAAAPAVGEWARAELVCRIASDVDELALTVVRADGTPAQAEPPLELRPLLFGLRSSMYERNRGAWLSARFLVDQPEGFHENYNYDHDPGWLPSLDPAIIARDLEEFPRAAERISPWLAQQLESAGSAPFGTGHDASGSHAGTPVCSQASPDRDSVPNHEHLDAARQREVLAGLTVRVAHFLPPGWLRLALRFQALGSYSETLAEVTLTGDRKTTWEPPGQLDEQFAELRRGMYRRDVGTWFSALLLINYPDEFSVEYSWDDEPTWKTPPTGKEYTAEGRLFPRDPDRTPLWLASAHQQNLGKALRRAAVFGRSGTAGPLGPERERLTSQETEQVLEYLRRPPVILAARGFGKDELAPGAPKKVPLTFRTDGTWIWSGAVEYHLQVHGLAPEAGFLEHIRRHGFQAPETSAEVRSAAVAAIKATAHGLGVAPRETAGDAGSTARGASGAPRSGGGQPWPFAPRAGDPPLTLLRDKELVTLDPGLEIDRYGEPHGNFAYTARTDYPNRSLPSDFRQRSYSVYRVERPIRAVKGVTVPWFGQPGGATAYVLERSVEDLLAEGNLVEIAG